MSDFFQYNGLNNLIGNQRNIITEAKHTETWATHEERCQANLAYPTAGEVHTPHVDVPP